MCDIFSVELVYFSFFLQKWPKADFHIVPDAGHSGVEPGIQTALLNAADKFKHL